MSQPINKNLKYVCSKCRVTKNAKIVILHTTDIPAKPYESEVIRTFKQTLLINGKEEKREFQARQLECNHFISFFTPAFVESNNGSNETLSEEETAQIRREIDKEMIGKNKEEVKLQILLHCEQYATYLRIAKKQQQQAKYAAQYLEQLKDKFVAQLDNDDAKQSMEIKFAHFLDQRPASKATLERERKSVKTEVNTIDKQKMAMEAMLEQLKKKGYDPKDLFGNKSQKSE